MMFWSTPGGMPGTFGRTFTLVVGPNVKDDVDVDPGTEPKWPETVVAVVVCWLPLLLVAGA